MKLKEYLKQNGLKQAWIAEQIGWSGVHISNVITGRFKPSLRFMKAVENFTKGQVKVSDFDEKKEVLDESPFESYLNF